MPNVCLRVCLCECVSNIHARVCESRAGSGVESGFCDACLIFDCLRSPPPTPSCHSTEQTPTSSDRECWPFRIRHALWCKHPRTHGWTHTERALPLLPSTETPFSSQTYLRAGISAARQPFQDGMLPFWFRACQLLGEDVRPSGPQMKLGCH